MNPNDSHAARGSSRRSVVEKELSHAIVGCFFDVYNVLGYGYLESIYSRALEVTLKERGLRVEREFPIHIIFRGQAIGFHRIDMLVQRRVVVELKSTERLPDISHRQLRSYVAALGVDLGILLHFGPVPRFYRQLGGFGHRPALRHDSGDSGHSGNSGSP